MRGLLAILTAEVTPLLAQLSRAHKIYRRPKEESPIGTTALLGGHATHFSVGDPIGVQRRR